MLRPIMNETSKTAKIMLVLYWSLGYNRSDIRSMAQYSIFYINSYKKSFILLLTQLMIDVSSKWTRWWGGMSVLRHVQREGKLSRGTVRGQMSGSRRRDIARSYRTREISCQRSASLTVSVIKCHVTKCHVIKRHVINWCVFNCL